jgi:hypothetical protein
VQWGQNCGSEVARRREKWIAELCHRTFSFLFYFCSVVVAVVIVVVVVAMLSIRAMTNQQQVSNYADSKLSPQGKVVPNFPHWGKLSVHRQIIAYLAIPIWGAIDTNAPNSTACSQRIFGRVFATAHVKPTHEA